MRRVSEAMDADEDHDLGDAPSPTERVVMRRLSAHTGESFEAGQTGRPRGEKVDGVPVRDARDGTAATPGMVRSSPWSAVLEQSASTSDYFVNGRKRQHKEASGTVEWSGIIKGEAKRYTVYEGTSPAEDRKWVLILEEKANARP